MRTNSYLSSLNTAAIKFGLGFAGVMSSATLATANPQPVPSEVVTGDNRVRISDVEQGSLLFKSDQPGLFVEAPQVKTDVDITVTGPIIRTVVTQVFENTSNNWVEGIYVFPLPEMAAVDQLKMIIGDRLIEGQVKEKQEARAIYETAKSAGKKASLLTQQRPNIFTNNVANIGPGESISIQIEYQDMAKLEDGIFSLRFPMTVAPRYSPPARSVQIADAGGKLVPAVLDPVLDRDLISPPVMPPQLEPVSYQRLPVTIDIELSTGFPLQTVISPYHDISVQQDEASKAVISLANGPVPANRDFKLEWKARTSSVPYAALFEEEFKGDKYLLAMITPPRSAIAGPDQNRHCRETIFVVDTSGSMDGTSIRQARAALHKAIDYLQPGDRFNIIRFDSSHSSVFPATVNVSDKNLSAARRFIDQMDAGGGTKMVPALRTGLKMFAGGKSQYLRQMIFITDGSIGNETEFFAVLKDHLGDTRFFPVGIGSAPNSFLISRAAKFGGGTSVQIGKLEEVGARMEGLFRNIDSAQLVDIRAEGLADSEMFPARLPDLYDGQPVIIVAKTQSGFRPDVVSVSGSRVNGNWAAEFNSASIESGTGISTLWARRKIAALEGARFDRAKTASIDALVLETALKYHLVSRLTSMVAVDVTPSRPENETQIEGKVPTQLPDGWDFAGLTQKAGHQSRARRSAAPAPASVPVPMPGTASPHNFLLILGLGLLWIARRFRRRAKPCA